MMVKIFLGCINIYKHDGQDCRMGLVHLTQGQDREAKGPGKYDGQTRLVPLSQALKGCGTGKSSKKSSRQHTSHMGVKRSH